MLVRALCRAVCDSALGANQRHILSGVPSTSAALTEEQHRCPLGFACTPHTLARFVGEHVGRQAVSRSAREDIARMQCVGHSKKRLDFGSSGRFGVGLNVMYRYCDCPQLLANNALHYFDLTRTRMSWCPARSTADLRGWAIASSPRDLPDQRAIRTFPGRVV